MLLLHRSTRSTLSHSWQHSTKWHMHAELYSPAHTLTQPSQGCRSDAQHDVLVVHFAWPRINSPSHTLLFAHPNSAQIRRQFCSQTTHSHSAHINPLKIPHHIPDMYPFPHCRQASVRLWHLTYSEPSFRCTHAQLPPVCCCCSSGKQSSTAVPRTEHSPF